MHNRESYPVYYDSLEKMLSVDLHCPIHHPQPPRALPAAAGKQRRTGLNCRPMGGSVLIWLADWFLGSVAIRTQTAEGFSKDSDVVAGLGFGNRAF